MREREKNREKREKTEANACEKSTKTKEDSYTLQTQTDATKKDIETNSCIKEVLKDIFVDRERENQY